MTISSKTKKYRSRTLAVAVLAAGLVASPWSMQLGSVLSSAAAQTAAPSLQAAPGSGTTQAKTKKPPSAGQVAMHERQKKCAAEWKQAKADGKLEKGMKWPKFWSACNKRLKGAG